MNVHRVETILLFVVLRRLKVIHSRSDTNRTGAEGLPFTIPDRCTAWIVVINCLLLKNRLLTIT